MSSAGALRTEGNEKFRSKQYFDAYRCYLAAAEKCPPRDKNQMANIYICLSKTEFILEKTEEAIISATKAIEIDPTNYRGYLSRANAYFETLSWEKAYQDLLKAQELEPSDNFIKQRIQLAETNRPNDTHIQDMSSRPLDTYSEQEQPQRYVQTRDIKLDLDDTQSRQVRTRDIQLDLDDTQSRQVQTRDIKINLDDTRSRQMQTRGSPYERQYQRNYQKTNQYGYQNQKTSYQTTSYQTTSYQTTSDPHYSRQNQRSFNDTLQPHSVPDPEPMSKTSILNSESTPSGKYTSAYNIELMNNLMNNKRPLGTEVLTMIQCVENILAKEPNIVKLNIKGVTLHIVGDTHGQYQDVIKLFEEQGFPSSTNPYLFNGDFVDRGSMGVEIVIALLAWKLYDPTCIYFNRGNHETRAMNAMYGFEKECTTKYNSGIYDAFADFFNTLPIGHLINDQILVVHGGISDSSMTISKVNSINRFQQPPDQGVINDILWADPMDSPGLAPSPRGVTKTFGPDVTQRFLNNNKLQYLIRSHQVQENGYLLQHNRKCITVFSAPNYVGSMYNKGAICDFTFGPDGSIKNGPTFITYSAQPIPRNYPPMKFSPFGGFY